MIAFRSKEFSRRFRDSEVRRQMVRVAIANKGKKVTIKDSDGKMVTIEPYTWDHDK